MKPARLEPTDDSQLDERIKEHIRQITPRLGIVEEVHPFTEEDAPSNYKVDVRLVEGSHEIPDDSEGGPTGGTEGGSSSPPTLHPYVPVAVTSTGSSKGLQVDDFVLIQYRRGDPNLPIVTHCLYDDSEPAPFTEPGDFRRKIGDAIIEVVTDEDGDHRINIGKQTSDREGIVAGLSINIDDGSFSLMNEDEHGLFVDEDGDSILRWESMAMPWGAAGDVNWDDTADGGDSGGDGDEETHTVTVTVQEADGSTVANAAVTIDLTDTEETEFEGTTSDAGSVSTDLPNGEYVITATHPDTNEVVEGSVAVDDADVATSVSFTE